MTHTHRLGVIWADGRPQGIVGEGWDEAQAEADAHRKLFDLASMRGHAFKVVKAAAVYTDLDAHQRAVILEDWDKHQYSSNYSYP